MVGVVAQDRRPCCECKTSLKLGLQSKTCFKTKTLPRLGLVTISQTSSGVSGFNRLVGLGSRVVQGRLKEMALAAGEWTQALCVTSQLLLV